jgi:hypothetical protein
MLLQGEEGERERKWRAWVDERFVKVRARSALMPLLQLDLSCLRAVDPSCASQVLTVNIYRNLSECFATMDYLSTIRSASWSLAAALAFLLFVCF